MSRSNKDWMQHPENAEDESQNQALCQENSEPEEDEEFGEFEGYESASQFEANMAAQVLINAHPLQPSPWSTYPDNVPSQRTASSALQPDLLPMQASMHASQMTDSNSSLIAGSSNFDLPDINPMHDSSGNQQSAGALDSAHSVGVSSLGAASTGAIMRLPDLSPTSSSSSTGGLLHQGQSHRVASSSAAVTTSQSLTLSSLPDVSARNGSSQARTSSIPDIRSSSNGIQQHLQGAILRTRASPKSGHTHSNGEASSQNSIMTNSIPNSHSGIDKSYFEDQLNNSRHTNQRFSCEVEELRGRVRELEGELSHCRSLLQKKVHEEKGEDIESIICRVMEKQNATLMDTIRQQVTKHTEERPANVGISEERLQALLLENTQQQISMVEKKLSTFSLEVNELIKSLQNSMQGCNDVSTMLFDLQNMTQKIMEEQKKRDAEFRGHILSCVEAVMTSSQQQLRAILQPTDKGS